MLAISATLSFAQKGKRQQYKYAKIETNFGSMMFELSNETPRHTANFVKLAKEGYFDKYDFNRVIEGFVAQGGETDSAYAAKEKTGEVLERIAPECITNLFHQKGALAAGRDDNKTKSSFLGQIYIVDGKKYTDSSLNAVEKRIGNGYKFSATQRRIYREIGGVPHLDQNYTVFGQLVRGFDVLDKLMNQKVDKAGKPETRILMKVKMFADKEISELR